MVEPDSLSLGEMREARQAMAESGKIRENLDRNSRQASSLSAGQPSANSIQVNKLIHGTASGLLLRRRPAPRIRPPASSRCKSI